MVLTGSGCRFRLRLCFFLKEEDGAFPSDVLLKQWEAQLGIPLLEMKRAGKLSAADAKVFAAMAAEAAPDKGSANAKDVADEAAADKA